MPDFYSDGSGKDDNGDGYYKSSCTFITFQVGNAGILLTKVLGKKGTRDRDYVVVDAAMTDLIRPCLYGAHHRIYPTRLEKSAEAR